MHVFIKLLIPRCSRFKRSVCCCTINTLTSLQYNSTAECIVYVYVQYFCPNCWLMLMLTAVHVVIMCILNRSLSLYRVVFVTVDYGQELSDTTI